MDMATSIEVGIRELKNKLSAYIDHVRDGEDVIVTDRGRPVARISPVDRETERLSELVAAGLVHPPTSPGHQPAPRVKAKGTVSDLVAEQRR